MKGFFVEKFINICIHRHILLWDVKRLKDGSFTLKISIKGFKLLRPVARKTKCKVKILEKRGIPFIIHRYRKRRVFLAGILIFIVLFNLLTSFIWGVEVKGNENIPAELILEKLAANRIKPGVIKYGIDTDRLVNRLMVEIKELAWIGIYIRGTKVKVEVKERVAPRAIVPKDQFCNVVAYRDGIIKSIIVRTGEPAVKVGDTVTRGQVLISGRVSSKNQEVPERLVHASGTVIARTWYEAGCPVETRVNEKARTGRVTSRYRLKLFTKEITLFGKKVEYENYDRVTEYRGLSIGKNLALPFGLAVDRFYENIIIGKELSLDEAKKLATEEANRKASARIPEGAVIVDRSMNFSESDDGKLIANVVIECFEDIGVEEGIGE